MTAPCGCRIGGQIEMTGTGTLTSQPEIIYCPLHAAAPQLLKACEDFVAHAEHRYRERNTAQSRVDDEREIVMRTRAAVVESQAVTA